MKGSVVRAWARQVKFWIGPVSDSTSTVQRLLSASDGGGVSGLHTGSPPAIVCSIEPDVSTRSSTFGAGGSMSLDARAGEAIRANAAAPFAVRRSLERVRIGSSWDQFGGQDTWTVPLKKEWLPAALAVTSGSPDVL